MSPRIRFTLILALLSLVVGCSRGLKEGLHVFKGSSGKVVLLRGADQASTLAAQYGTVKVQPFTSDIGDRCPTEFLTELPLAIQEQLLYRSASLKEKLRGKKKEELGPFFTGPAHKILLIKGNIIQYDLGSAIDKAASPLDEAICRVQILDDNTNTLLIEANCTGRVKSALRTGPQELAKGVAKAIRKMLKPKK